MAKLSNIPSAADDSRKGLPDLSSVELAQLLSRLKQGVLHPTPERERRLRTSEYERTRVEANLQHARGALAKREQTAQGRSLGTQGDLAAQRETLELLFDRLEDLRKVAMDDDGDSSDEEDLLADMIPTPSECSGSRSSSDAPKEVLNDRVSEPEPEPSETSAAPERTSELPANEPESTENSTAATEHPATQTTQSLRARPSAQSSELSAHTTARAALFANRGKPSRPQTTAATAEAILDQQRAEQDAISESILKMAGALKQSSKSFSAALEADKGLLDAAGSSMEKSELSMEAAQGRMGSLRRMTEGKGWWGRMMLYVWVYGLMVALVLFVFVIPKLRF